MFKSSYRLRTLCAIAHNLSQCSFKPAYEECSRYSCVYLQLRQKKSDASISSLFIPVPVKAKPNPDDINVGAELTGTLNKADLLKVLNKFYQQKEIKQLLVENGLDSK